MKFVFSFVFFALVGLGLGAPVGVVFDSDMANDCDDAGALAVLHGLADLGEVEILAVVTNRKDPSGASAADQSVTYCSVGALSNLEDLVRSQPDEISPLSGLELITQKIKLTCIMGGGFPRTANPETNIKLDPAAAVTVVNEWPGPILWQGYEVGAAIITGAELQKTPASNPVRRAFELRPHHGAPALAHGKPSHDQATVLLAVRGAQRSSSAHHWR